MNLKTLWITLCFNEIDIIPFARKYWERIGCDVVVFDNGSTDGSIELLQSLPYCTVRHFDSAGQNDVIQKTVKETAYMEYKDKYDVIIITDMDELFFFNDFEKAATDMIEGGYNCIVVNNYALCEDFKPQPSEEYYLHEQCHKFYKQKLNHMNGYGELSKLSIFNTKATSQVCMSVGQHYVKTLPNMQILLRSDGFCLHVDKGFNIEYKFKVRQRMNDNLSITNKQGGMCVEYGQTYEALKEEYLKNQESSFDINKLLETDVK